ncbi:MAG: tetratricopeptide repeat protein, partial [bacterium]
AQLTKAHTTVGTAAYMSPEHARGEEADHRSDIWSFGVVLYEMLTGKMPFPGDYEQAVIYSILNEKPQPVAELRDDVPDFLAHVVVTALAKRPDERYQEMAVVLQDLRDDAAAKPGAPKAAVHRSQKENRGKRQNRAVMFALLAAFLIIAVAVVFWNQEKSTPKAEIKRIAVLPLENLGPAEQDYFADGLTGEITSRLSGLSGLSVIARSSAMQYKKTTKSLRQIGEELNIDYVLEGTLQWQENAQGVKRIRVNPELIKIADATQIWSQPYEADFSNAFKLQADIAATVAEALNITLVKSEQQALRGALTTNSKAYDVYLRAQEYSLDITDEKKIRIAEQLFRQAIVLDSNFAAAYAGLSSRQSDIYWSYFERSENILEQSKTNAQKALRLNPKLPEAHVAMGDYHYHGRLDYKAALDAYNEALRLQPNNVKAINGIGFVLRRQGQMREAITNFKKSLKLDPINYETVFSVGETYRLLREYDLAIPLHDRAISLAPDVIAPYEGKADIYLLKDGDIKEARNFISGVWKRKIGLDSPLLRRNLFLCDIFSGDLNQALEQIDGIEQIDYQFFYTPEDLFVAHVYRLMNNKTLAKKHYESARDILQEKIKDHADDSRLYTALGIAHAGLGQKADAIRAGKRGVELLPISKEAWRGSFRLFDLAKIYVTVGEPDLAMDLLDDLLGRPTDAISVALLKIDPTWAPLHGQPRFQELLKKYSSGESE